MTRRIFLFAVTALLIIVIGSPASHADSDRELWGALKSPGHIAFMRHALAPGTGDPDNFRIDDCSTQRNLSDAGRRQAKRTGDAFRANGINSARVFSSQWCRCKETAELLGLGNVVPLPDLNSLYRHPGKETAQIEGLTQKISSMELSDPAVMVTHQFTIRALLKTSTRSGEIVVVRREQDGTLTVRGKIAPRSTD